jgi:hypothetical protein
MESGRQQVVVVGLCPHQRPTLRKGAESGYGLSILRLAGGRMKVMRPIVAKFRNYQEAEEATREHYRRLSPAERLEILFSLRALAHKDDDATSGRLACVYRIAQLKRG